MYRYKIKVASLDANSKSKLSNYLDLKIFKKRDIRNLEKKDPKNFKKENLILERADRSFILNRYNGHLLMKKLYSDLDGKKKDGRFSYTMVYKDVLENRDKKYSKCSKQDAFLILKTSENIENKIEEINEEYRKYLGNKVQEKNLKSIKFIKEFGSQGFEVEENGIQSLYLKQSSPVILKTNIGKLLNIANKNSLDDIIKDNKEDYGSKNSQDIKKMYDVRENKKTILKKVHNLEEKIEKMYTDKEGNKNKKGKRYLNSSVFILPKSIGSQNDKAPTLYIDDNDYIDLLLFSVGKERMPSKTYELIPNKISVIKLNKYKNGKNGKNNYFNVIGSAFEFKTDDFDLIQRINISGLGNLQGFGFGFVFTENLSEKAMKNRTQKNINK